MTIHLYDPRHVCKNCGKKFFSRSAVDRHRKNKLCGSKTVEEDEEYLLRIQRYCRFCDQKFLNIIEKTAHLCKYQHHDYSKKVFCRICEKVVTKQNFNNHMETHGDGLICTVCGKKLTGSRTLKGKNN